MSTYGIPHILSALLRTNRIDGREVPDLFDAAVRHANEVRRVLDPLGMEMAIDTHWHVVVARNKSDEDLDRIARDGDLLPIEPAFTMQRMTYWESCAIHFFRQELDKEVSLAGKEIWFYDQQVKMILGRDYTKGSASDEARLDSRVEATLTRLERLGLIGRRSIGQSTMWRGTNYLAASIPAEAFRDFEEQCLSLLKAGAEDLAGPEAGARTTPMTPLFEDAQ